MRYNLFFVCCIAVHKARKLLGGENTQKLCQPPKYWKVGHCGAPLEIRDLITVFWVFAHIGQSEKIACVKIVWPPDNDKY